MYSATCTGSALLAAWGAKRGQDYFTLTSFQIELVLESAKHVKYYKPKNANGSRARCFYEKTQREARRESK